MTRPILFRVDRATECTGLQARIHSRNNDGVVVDRRVFVATPFAVFDNFASEHFQRYVATTKKLCEHDTTSTPV